MAVNQVSVFVENKSGALVDTIKVLGNAQIDIRAMSIADTNDFGILRLIVSDSEKAQKVLKDNNAVVAVNKVVAVAISDRPGALSGVLEILAKEDIAIEYIYAFITVSKEYAYVVIRVQDNEKAEKILLENGINLVTEDDIKAI
ncbi:MAG: acetolactate synthase [Acutalibacteraceae bacterium]